MAGVDNRITNVLGAKLPYWLISQLQKRSEIIQKNNRSNQDLLHIANKTGWVRLVSSINLSKTEDNNSIGDMKYFSDITGLNLSNESDLAKNFILYGGTSKYAQSNNKRGFSYQLRSGLGNDGSYGMLGTSEIQEFGYRPMPGITDATIETMGRLGSVRLATINFKVWDKSQLDVIDALYFKLGYSMLLEWGHTNFFASGVTPVSPATTNPETLYSFDTENYCIDPFTDNLTKEQILYKISDNIRQTEGNYEAMLGIVTNYNFSLNQEGGFDCSLRVIALGALADSIKINHPDNLPDILIKEIKALDNTLVNIRNEKIRKENAEEEARLASERKAQEDLLRKNQLITGSIDNYISNNKNINNIPYYYLPANQRIDSSISQFGDIIFKANETPIGIIRKFGLAIPVGTPGDSLDTKNLINTITLDKDKIKLLFSEAIQSGNPDTFDFKPDLLIDNSKTQKANLYYYGSISSPYVTQKSNRYVATIQFDSTDAGVRGKPNADANYNRLDLLYKYLTRNDYTITNTDTSQFWASSATQPNITKNTFSVARITSNEINSDKDLFVEKLPNGETRDTYLFNTYSRTDRLTQDKQLLAFYITGKIPYTLFENKEVEETDFSLEEGIRTTTETKPVPVKKYFNFRLVIYETSVLKNIRLTEQGQKQLGFEEYIKNQVAQNQQQFIPQQEITSSLDVSSEKFQTAINLQSSLEIILRTIQVHSLNVALNKKGEDLQKSVYKLQLTEDKKFIDQIFSSGIFSPFKNDLFYSTNKIQDVTPSTLYKNSLNKVELLKVQSKYGFNTQYMTNGDLTDVPIVNYKDLLTSYVIPYEINQTIYEGTSVNHPVYISLGFLLMLLNNMCTIYDTTKESKDKNGDQTPLVYIDFNPETNLCLSNAKHLSTDAFKFIIPFQGFESDYAELFDKNVLVDNSFSIRPISGSTDTTPLFDVNKDALSGNIPQFKKDNAYRGYVMNVLINIEYLLAQVKTAATNDGSNSVYLKPFIEAILTDMNKSMGDFNAFRLSYNDYANTFQIVDDQLVPDTKADTQIAINSPANTTELPVYGKTSIAKNLELRTEMSNKLASMIAISANADVKNAMSLDATSVGYINTNYIDRYIVNRTDAKPPEKKAISNDANINAAIMFNDTINQFYRTVTPSEAGVSQATNYYIKKMSRIKAEETPTRAASLIPVSLNFTTDGISGIRVGHGFTISDKFLPYTYNARTINNNDYQQKVGFCVVGVTHTISNNVWDTSIKSQMIYLKNPTEYVSTLNEVKTNNTFLSENPIIKNVPITNAETKNNIAIAVKYFKSKGYNDFAISALVGGFVQESQMNPLAVNNLGAIGIAQWLDRRLALINYAKSNGKNYTDLQIQLDFVIYELNGLESKSGAELKRSTTLDQAIQAAANYERFNGYNKGFNIGSEWGKRIGYAKTILENIKNGIYN